MKKLSYSVNERYNSLEECPYVIDTKVGSSLGCEKCEYFIRKKDYVVTCGHPETGTDEYELEAERLLTLAGVSLKVHYSHTGPHFEREESNRDIYNITLNDYTFTFGDSIQNTEKRLGTWKPYRLKGLAIDYLTDLRTKHKKEHRPPNAYAILSALTKYDPGTFKNFCDDYGYDNDSISAQKTYFRVQEEYENVSRIFAGYLDQLSEIQ